MKQKASLATSLQSLFRMGGGGWEGNLEFQSASHVTLKGLVHGLAGESAAPDPVISVPEPGIPPAQANIPLLAEPVLSIYRCCIYALCFPGYQVSSGRMLTEWPDGPQRHDRTCYVPWSAPRQSWSALQTDLRFLPKLTLVKTKGCQLPHPLPIMVHPQILPVGQKISYP